MGSNAKKRLLASPAASASPSPSASASASASAPAPARSAASKRLKRRQYVVDDDEDDADEELTLPPPLPLSSSSESDEEVVTGNENEESDGPNDLDLDSDSDGSDDELETAAPAAPSGNNTEDEINRVLKPLGLDAFGTDVPFLDLLLGVSAISDEHRVALSTFKQECLDGMSTGQLSQSLEPTDAFLAREQNQEWASHDNDIDTMWDEFVGDIVRLGEGAIKREDLVKPSGPLRAVLTFFWHYPTWNTKKKGFGHVFDKTNPSLRFQNSKMGPNAWVRTHDRFPFRHPYVSQGVDWESEYPNWAGIEARCRRFNKDMIKHSKVIFFIGQENHDSWKSFITLAQGDRIHQVQLGSAGFNLPGHVYKSQPAFHAVRDSSGTVKQLVFSSYHSQYCINGNDPVRGAYMDLTWNAALNFAELEIKQYDTFTRGMGLNPKEPTRFRCCFVDPETNERCCSTRQTLKYIQKHWDACHGKVEGASWDESLVTALPKEVALALDPGIHRSGKAYTNAERTAAHREAVLKRKEERKRANAVPVVKQRQRIGRRPKKLGKTQYRCYYVDLKTGEQCKTTYGTKESLGSMHFKKKHPHSRWDTNLVQTVKEDREQWNTSRAPLEIVTTQKNRKQTMSNARSAKSRAARKDKITLKCNFCSYTNKNHRSNMKTHVEKNHPNVIWNSKTSFTVIQNDAAESDKENEE